jgi:hypothetical protein
MTGAAVQLCGDKAVVESIRNLIVLIVREK